MGKKKNQKIKWLDEPEKHDYNAAEDFLKLIFNDGTSGVLVSKLLFAKVQYKKAKDIFRASGESLLGVSNSHVKKNKKKIEKGEKLSPILLVTNTKQNRLIIADGYHRVCAVYYYDEDALIPCKKVTE